MTNTRHEILNDLPQSDIKLAELIGTSAKTLKRIKADPNYSASWNTSLKIHLYIIDLNIKLTEHLKTIDDLIR